MTASMIITAVLIVIGLLFMFASLIGIAELPDFFTRLHAQGIGDTIGAFLILAGMMVAVHGGLMSVKILLIFIVIVLTNPIGTNLMMIAAINKEDYLGYRSRMEGSDDEKPEPEPKPVPEPEPAPAAEASVKSTEDNAGDKKEKKAAEEKPEEKVKPDKPAETTKPDEPAEKENKEAASDKPETSDKPQKSGKQGRPAKNKKKSSDKKPADKADKKEDSKPAEKQKKKSADKPADKKSDKPADTKDKAPKKKRKRKPSMSMNRAELIKAAENRGIKVPESATKREILDLIYAGKEDKSGK